MLLKSYSIVMLMFVLREIHRKTLLAFQLDPVPPSRKETLQPSPMVCQIVLRVVEKGRAGMILVRVFTSRFLQKNSVLVQSRPILLLGK